MFDPMPTTAVLPQTDTVVRTHEGTAMLLHEALARSRMQQLQHEAREHDLARSVTAGSRWEVLARFASRRAERARSGASRPVTRLA